MTTCLLILICLACCLAPRASGQNSDPSYEDKVNARIERMKSDQIGHIEYSQLSADELVTCALGHTTREPVTVKLLADEISRRPTEFKEAILKLLDSDQVDLEQLIHMPYWAKYVSDKFQVEVAKKAILHTVASNSDVLVIDTEFCAYFDSNDAIKQEVLNILIEQGRLERNSKTYNWWIKSASERKSLLVNANVNHSKIPDGNHPSGIDSDYKPWYIHKQESWYWLGAVGLLVLVIGYYLFKRK